MKDPLNKEETPYSFFSRLAKEEITPDTPIKKIRKVYMRLLAEYPGDEEVIEEMWKLCNTVSKRLKIDFFYYYLPKER
jgi:hypothetical protein